MPPTAKPYLVRAIYDWCLAQGHSPYLLVAVAQPGVRVPQGYEKDGRITLNINPRAVQSLELGIERIRFSARFGASSHQVEVPYLSIVAIFAAETHEGMVFGDPHTPLGEAQPAATSEPAPEPEPEPSPDKGPRRLRLVE
ncbi:MAG: ClpXP protease specificity-enhancing factor [Nitrospirae bacterium]|nr:ClpXP protease specificity-enhancing factor [Nitrospirota bacterium]